MTNREKHDPNSQGYTNALLEDIEDKFQAVLEATQPIPKMQEQISGLEERTGSMQEQISGLEERTGSMQEQIKRILTWEDDIKLIPVIFEEVGALRKEVETIKAAMKLLDRHDKRIEKIEERLADLEQRVH